LHERAGVWLVSSSTGEKYWRENSEHFPELFFQLIIPFLLLEELCDSDSLIAEPFLKTHLSHPPWTILMSSSLLSSLASLINVSRFLSGLALVSDEASLIRSVKLMLKILGVDVMTGPDLMSVRLQ